MLDGDSNTRCRHVVRSVVCIQACMLVDVSTKVIYSHLRADGRQVESEVGFDWMAESWAFDKGVQYHIWKQ